ncbi:MAG: DegT/DnrJ/EryC1/StrS family aminotransferase [Blastocatellia bacterium]
MSQDSNAQLALLGGPAAITRELPAWPLVEEADRQALLEVIESKTWGGYHETVGEFERRFAAYHGASHGIALANGTLSLEIALIASGIRPGDEVIVPPITFVASASAIARVGAIPVFVDIDPQTINLDPAAVATAITERTRAMMVVHFAGCPADLDSLTALCERHGLVMIEDCAHAHGAEWRGRRVGSFGAFGSFSFQASKNMTAGEGGMLITNDAELAERARAISNQGRRSGGAWYEHATLGTNARLTGFQAAILLQQLDRLPRQVATRTRSAARLSEGLAGIDGFTPTPESLDERVTAHAWHIFSMSYDEQAFGGVPRQRIVEALRAEGLPATLGYPQPIYRNELFQQQPHLVHACPEAEAYCRRSVWLPHNLILADDQLLDETITALHKVHRAAPELRSPQPR